MKTRALLFSAAVLGSALAQEPPKPDQPPRPPEAGREERPPLPPGEQRERPPRGPEGREEGERPERPPFPPPGGERRPEGFTPRDGERPRGGGMEGRRFEGERRQEQPGFPSNERGTQQRMKPTPYLGVVSAAAPAALSVQLGLGEGFGLVVDEVLPDSPAQKAGVQRYDVLKQLNEQLLVDPSQLGTLVRGLGKDAEATLTLIRKGQEQNLTVKIGEKMLPERRIEEPRGNFSSPDMRRGGEMSRGGSSDQWREMQERMRGFQEKMRDYQEEMKKWQEKREGEMPKMPPFPMMEPPRQRPTGANEQPGQPLNPADILRDMKPGAPGQVRNEWSDGASRWDASRARVKMRDREGEVELGMKDGHRTLTVKNSSGETIFTGAVDTPEERNAVPEPFRGKLDALEVAPQPPQQPRPDGFRSGPRQAEPQPGPQSRPREAGVQ